MSSGDVWDSINRFNPATFLCFSQARIWICSVICRGLSCVQGVLLGCKMIVCVVDVVVFLVFRELG
jgi:hypothetical protein